MSLYCVKVSLKLRADAALTPIYAPKSELYHEIVFSFTSSGVSGHFPGGTIPHTFLVFITIFHKNAPNTGCPVLGVHITEAAFLCLEIAGI